MRGSAAHVLEPALWRLHSACTCTCSCTRRGSGSAAPVERRLRRQLRCGGPAEALALPPSGTGADNPAPSFYQAAQLSVYRTNGKGRSHLCAHFVVYQMRAVLHLLVWPLLVARWRGSWPCSTPFRRTPALAFFIAPGSSLQGNLRPSEFRASCTVAATLGTLRRSVSSVRLRLSDCTCAPVYIPLRAPHTAHRPCARSRHHVRGSDPAALVTLHDDGRSCWEANGGRRRGEEGRGARPGALARLRTGERLRSLAPCTLPAHVTC